MQSEKLIGHPIIHIDLGKRCGVVQGLVLDPERRCVAGLVVGLPGWRKRGLLPMEYVYAIGEQAVTIVDEVAIKSADEESDLRSLWQRKLTLDGTPVLTVTGRGLGSVQSFDFELGGAIKGITVHRSGWGLRRSQNKIPGELIRSFGEDAVIVEAEAEQAVVPVNADDREKTTGRHLSTAEPNSDSTRPSVADRWKERITGWGRRSQDVTLEVPQAEAEHPAKQDGNQSELGRGNVPN